MLAFEVSVNGEVVCVAGLDEYGVLTAILSWVRRRPDAEFKPDSEELEFSVSGLASDARNDAEHLDWLKRELRVGDIVSLRVIEIERADEPAMRKRENPIHREKQERAYYERMKRKYDKLQS
jgi:hypothetical protein